MKALREHERGAPQKAPDIFEAGRRHCRLCRSVVSAGVEFTEHQLLAEPRPLCAVTCCKQKMAIMLALS